MKEVAHKELETLIKECYRKKVPLFIWGNTGIGKSDTVKKVAKEIAKKKGLEYNEDIRKINESNLFSLVDVRISQMDISDLRGIPVVDKETGVTKWLPPNWLPKDSQGILFFDELNLSVPAIQSSAYQLILDRRLCDYVLPDGWVIVSAGNRLEDRANVFELPRPLQNRFIHTELSIPDVDSWIEWAIENNIDTRISTFLKFKPSLLFKIVEDSKDKSFPTPRSWAFCSKLICDVDSSKMNLLHMLVSSAVGEATALEFKSWLKLKEKIDIKSILNNPLEAKLPKTPDLIYSMISGVIEYYKKDKKKLRAIVQLATRLEAEFSVLLLKLSKTYNKNFVKDIMKFPEWTDRKNGLGIKLSKYFDV